MRWEVWEENEKESRERRGEEHLQNGGAKGKSKGGTFFCSSDVFKADPFGFLFLCFSHSPLPLSSHLCSFSHHLSEVSVAAGHSVVDLDFLSPFVFYVWWSVCLLSWIIGVELHRAWHLELMSQMMRQGKQRQLHHPPLPQYPNIQTHAKSYTHILCKHICSPLTSNVCICHNKPVAELGEKGECTV